MFVFQKNVIEKAQGRLFTDNSGNVMLLMANYAVLTYDSKSNQFSAEHNPFRLPPGWKANWITQDRNNDYWIACDSGLVKFNVKKSTLSYRGHNTDNEDLIAAFAHLYWVNTPYFDKKGRCWLVSWSRKDQMHFYSYDTATKKLAEWKSQITSALGHAYFDVDALSEQKDGSLWLFGGKLLARLNKKRDALEIVRDNLAGEFSIRYDDIRQLFEDRENNLWACTNNGLYRFNPSAQIFHKIVNKRAGPGQHLWFGCN
jgi:ligand-binding sensor domain-containing protein